jgi:hypothetical protein
MRKIDNKHATELGIMMAIGRKFSLLAIMSVLAAGPVSLQAYAADDPYSSPYMNAADTPLVALENGALVSPDTVAYWTLDQDSPKRTSYDREAVIKVAEGVWTLASESIVNIHVIKGPNGLIVYDVGDNLDEGEHFYKLLRSASDEPIRAIIYSHEHYAIGAQVFVDKEAERGNKDIMIIGHPNTNTSMARTSGLAAVHPEVSGVLLARTIEQFNLYLPDEGPDARFKNTIIPGKPGFVPVNTPVEDGQVLNSPLKKAPLTGFHAAAKHIAAMAVSPSSETMRTT